MAGMRDIIIHRYDEVDLSIVWTTISDDIPKVIDQLLPIIPKAENQIE